MSRTDNTKPLWVRYTEHSPRPTHDHRYGPCDLPPRPAREDAGTRCRWEPGMLLFGYTHCAGCQRRSCIAERQEMDKAANRKERYAGRREARRILLTGDTD
ncbi:hypothetical protein GCM10010129_00370 [Streptomyces fumigatiscleroticus]|nr:hypothetical protein GCM10010129_00370 [Streptomyces fumigatiscleroticus]